MGSYPELLRSWSEQQNEIRLLKRELERERRRAERAELRAQIAEQDGLSV